LPPRGIADNGGESIVTVIVANDSIEGFDNNRTVITNVYVRPPTRLLEFKFNEYKNTEAAAAAPAPAPELLTFPNPELELVEIVDTDTTFDSSSNTLHTYENDAFVVTSAVSDNDLPHTTSRFAGPFKVTTNTLDLLTSTYTYVRSDRPSTDSTDNLMLYVTFTLIENGLTLIVSACRDAVPKMPLQFVPYNAPLSYAQSHLNDKPLDVPKSPS